MSSLLKNTGKCFYIISLKSRKRRSLIPSYEGVNVSDEILPRTLKLLLLPSSKSTCDSKRSLPSERTVNSTEILLTRLYRNLSKDSGSSLKASATNFLPSSISSASGSPNSYNMRAMSILLSMLMAIIC